MDYSIILPISNIIDLLNGARRQIFPKSKVNRSIAGLVFFPIRLDELRTSPCIGIRIRVAYWIPNRPDTLEFAELDQNYRLIYNPLGPLPQGRPNERTLNNLSHNVWTLDPFQDFQEFDLVFLDYFQCMYLAGIQEDITYGSTSWMDIIFGRRSILSYYTQIDSNYYNSPQNPNTRGIQFSRGLFNIDVRLFENDRDINGNLRYTDTNLRPYRTIKFNPWPVPELQVYNSRASVAYHLGVACPPGWSPNATNFAESIMLFGLWKKAVDLQIIPEPPK